MNKIPFQIILLLFFSCTKEDSQNPKLYTSFSGPQYTISITAGNGGNFNAAACPASTEDACRNIFHNGSRFEAASVSFPAGTFVTIRAFPDEGYKIASWSNGSTDEIIVVFLDSNLEVTVSFSPD